MRRPPPKCYEFGPFVVDMAERRLLNDGEPVPLTRKTFETLLVLVENHGRVVDKEYLMKQVWPDANVEMANLTQTVFMLRKALGGSYIGTVPGRGYRLVGEVREVGGALARAAAATGPRGEEEAGGGHQEASVSSLAVLPLTDDSEHPGAGGLCESVIETVIHNLSRLQRTRVMARSAVSRYKGRVVDPLTAGQELGVQAVLTGRAYKLDERLIISMEMVDVARGWQLWSGRYARNLSELPSAHEDLAREITESLYGLLDAA